MYQRSGQWKHSFALIPLVTGHANSPLETKPDTKIAHVWRQGMHAHQGQPSPRTIHNAQHSTEKFAKLAHGYATSLDAPVLGHSQRPQAFMSDPTNK